MWRPRSTSTVWFIVATIATTAPALGGEPSKKAPQTNAKPPKEKLVCTTETVTGSLMPKRVCFTQKQIEAQREAVDDLQRERRELGGTSYNDRGMTPSGSQSGR